MGKALADVALRIWTPQAAKIKFVKQVSPDDRGPHPPPGRVGPAVRRLPDRRLGRGRSASTTCASRSTPGGIGQEMRAGWVKLVQPDTGMQLAAGNILATWTDDPAQSTQINPRVAHYTGQAELANLIQEGLQAHREHDFATATARLGRARQIAEESGNEATAKLLDRVLDVDRATGTVRLKPIDRAAEIALDVGSVRTVRTRRDPDQG